MNDNDFPPFERIEPEPLSGPIEGKWYPLTLAGADRLERLFAYRSDGDAWVICNLIDEWRKLYAPKPNPVDAWLFFTLVGLLLFAAMIVAVR